MDARVEGGRGAKKKTDISLSREKRLAAKGDLFSASLLLFHQGGKTGAKNRDEKDAKRKGEEKAWALYLSLYSSLRPAAMVEGGIPYSLPPDLSSLFPLWRFLI